MTDTPPDVDPVDPEAVLEAVESLDVTIPEMDFESVAGGQYAGVGSVRDPLSFDADHANTVPERVALAAIKGLADRLDRQGERIDWQKRVIDTQQGVVKDQRDDLETLRERLESIQVEVVQLRLAQGESD